MLSKLTLVLLASLVAAPAVAGDKRFPDYGGAAPARGVYFGVFGGGSFDSGSDIKQRGTVFFMEAMGGPLAVNATGRTDSGSSGFVGAQIGHEWSTRSGVLSAFEIEGLHLSSGSRRATLQNPTDRIAEQTFENTFPTDRSVFLANIVLSFPTSHMGITPYIGGGIGAARVSVSGANSLQVNPTEGPLNHFNSGPDSSAWTFAAQAKAGLRIALGSNAYVFGEYRYLFVGSTDQIFGSTVEPGHAATTAWTVQFSETSHHLATAGLGFNF